MARRCGSVLPTIRKPDSCTWPRAKSARATSSATRPTKSARSSRAAAKTSFPRMTPGAPSKRSKLSRASCAGSSSCTRRHGPACFRQRAAWFSPALMKAIYTRSMRARENRFGIFRPAARLLPIRFPSPSTVTNRSPSPPTASSTFSVCDPFIACCSFSREAFEDTGGAHAPANAHGHHAVARVAPLQVANNRGREFRPGAAERMAEGDRAAVGIDLCGVQTGLLDDGERLRGERFVEFDDRNVVQRKPRKFQSLGNSRDRANAEFFRKNSCRGVSQEARERLCAERFRARVAHHH